MVSRRLNAHRKVDLVYLDAGIYSGLEGEIKYRTLVEKQDGTVPEETSTVFGCRALLRLDRCSARNIRTPCARAKRQSLFFGRRRIFGSSERSWFQRFSTSQDLRVGFSFSIRKWCYDGR